MIAQTIKLSRKQKYLIFDDNNLSKCRPTTDYNIIWLLDFHGHFVYQITNFKKCLRVYLALTALY